MTTHHPHSTHHHPHHHPISRRVWLRYFSAATLMTLLEACGGNAPEPTPSPTAPSVAPTATRAAAPATASATTSAAAPTPTTAPAATATRPPTAAPSATPMPAPSATATASGQVRRLPIFDTHNHYSQNSWSYTPKQIIEKMERAHVRRALVSSSPDEGTRRLFELDPGRIVPSLRPYNNDIGSTNWYEHPQSIPYMQKRLETPIYQSLGEIHLHVEAANSPVTQLAIRMALERNLYLHIHSDAKTIHAVFAQAPQAKILWAHAGLSEPPQVVAETLAQYKNLWVDISIRENEIGGQGRLSPNWRALFEKHPDRITIGSDTWVPSRWDSYEEIIELDRTWLGQLPLDLAEKIAYRNAVRLFGAGPQKDLE